MFFLNSFDFNFIKIIDLLIYLALIFIKLAFIIRLEIVNSAFLSKFTVFSKSTLIRSTSTRIFTDITTIYCSTHIKTANISRSTFLFYFLSQLSTSYLAFVELTLTW